MIFLPFYSNIFCGKSKESFPFFKFNLPIAAFGERQGLCEGEGGGAVSGLEAIWFFYTRKAGSQKAKNVVKKYCNLMLFLV